MDQDTVVNWLNGGNNAPQTDPAVDWSRMNQPFGTLTDTNPKLYDTKAGPIYQSDVDKAMNLGMSFSGGGLSIGGPKAQTFNPKLYEHALDLQAKGTDPKLILRATGMDLRDPHDKIPRIEVPTHELKVKYLDPSTPYTAPAKDLIHWPQGWEAYPQVGKIPTTVSWNPKAVGGSFIRTPGQEHLYIEAPNTAEARRVAGHELTHAFGNEEGFSPGTSPDFIEAQLRQSAKARGYKPFEGAEGLKLLKDASDFGYVASAGENPAYASEQRLDVPPNMRNLLPWWENQLVKSPSQYYIHPKTNEIIGPQFPRPPTDPVLQTLELLRGWKVP